MDSPTSLLGALGGGFLTSRLGSARSFFLPTVVVVVLGGGGSGAGGGGGSGNPATSIVDT